MSNANTYIQTLQHTIRQMTGFVGLKDLNSRIIAINQSSAKMIGFSNIEDTIGVSDYELKCDAAEYADVFIKQDQQTIKAGKKMSLDIMRYSDGDIHTIFTQKMLLKDFNHEPMGVFCVSSVVNQEFTNRLGHALIEKNTSLGVIDIQDTDAISPNQTGKYKLTAKEMECLFYTLRGKSNKDIASILHRSPRTIDSHIDNIKIKFNVDKKSDLIETAIAAGYMNILPKSLLNPDLVKGLK